MDLKEKEYEAIGLYLATLDKFPYWKP